MLAQLLGRNLGTGPAPGAAPGGGHKKTGNISRETIGSAQRSKKVKKKEGLFSLLVVFWFFV